MLNVLRHYLPLRKALLIGSELVLLTLVVGGVMALHLWDVSDETRRLLAAGGLDPVDARWRVLFSSFLVACLSQVMLGFNELYDFRVSTSRFERMARFLTSASSAVLLVALAVALVTYWDVPRVLEFPGLNFSPRVVLLTTSLFVAFGLVYLWRSLFHLVLRRSRFHERVLILGSGRPARRLMDELFTRADEGYELVALLAHPDESNERRRLERRGSLESSGTGNPWYEASVRGDTPPELVPGNGARAALAAGAKILLAPRPNGSPQPEPVETHEALSDLARRLAIDEIVVAFEERRGSLPTEELLRCRLEGVRVEESESFYERLTGKIPAEAMRPSYLIFNPGFDTHPLAAALKRFVDACLSLLGILVLWPVMLAVALAIRLDSPGPVLFRQERTGQRGRPFSLCKFRSMRVDAEKLSGPVWATEDDPRVTRVGRFIRKTRLDEVPQLFNILAGSMSLVGPRPERPHFVHELALKIPYYNQRHIVKPGLTGWAQINYPYGNTVEDALQKLQYDLFYIKYQSTLFDLSILANTVKTVLLRKGT